MKIYNKKKVKNKREKYLTPFYASSIESPKYVFGQCP